MHTFETLSIPTNAVGIHWFGQNSFALKDTAGTIIQIDPYFPHERTPERFVHTEPPLDETDLKTDLVLLTHDHGDHTCIESLQRIHNAFPDVSFAGPMESVQRMLDNGFPQDNLITIKAGETHTLVDIKVHSVWAKPPLGVPDDGIRPPGVQHLSYIIAINGVHVYVTGDLINTFADHDELIAPITAIQPDIGLLTTHPTEGEFPYFEGSIKLAKKLGLKTAIPAHYDCFAKRTYDPHIWAAGFPSDGPLPLIIPYNTAAVVMIE